MSRELSLMTRLTTAKLTGFAIGFIGFLSVPRFWPDETMWLRFGFWAWYTTLGVVIGMFGVMDRHPVLKVPLPSWFRGPMLGGWMNFVLVLLMHDKLTLLMQALPPGLDWFRSPMWFVGEGMIVGLVIDGVATRFGGEGWQP